ncbi:vWA domain-containing protein [Nesterenkonia alba]|uniref:vWA domain-containing protein n=1 Tax=Nesterenkonia alba TaxID=515814 RepID=UPI00146DC2BF|nr:vWA domain-containing protein [Nesterenkonia alba]
MVLKWISRLGVAFSAAALATAGGLLPASATQENAPDDALATNASQIATCLQSARSISGLFLFDQSGSLSSNDPDEVRYEGLETALLSLSRLQHASEATGDSLDIEVAVSAFDGDYYPARDVVGWTQLNDGEDADRGEIIDQIVTTTAERTQPEGGTNFEAALEGAAEDLADRGTRGNCRVLFWFTDGEFERAEDSVEAARERMCREDGLLDEMRAAGITIIGLQLNMEDLDSDDLLSMATGSSGTQDCGTVPVPSDWANGAFLHADDTAGLRRLFGSLGNIIEGCTPQGERGAEIDPGVGRLNVTLETLEQTEQVELTAPDGTVITAGPDGTVTESGYTAVAHSDESYHSVTVTLPPGAASGTWSVSSVPETEEEFTDWCVYPGVSLQHAGGDEPTAGQTAHIAFDVVDTHGGQASFADYEDVTLTAAAHGEDGHPREATAEMTDDGVVVAVDTEDTDARIQVRVSAQPTTISGLHLTPVGAEEGIALALSSVFPSVRPLDELDLGSAVRQDPATAELTLSGSPDGPTEVCLGEPETLTVPEEVSGDQLTVETGCIGLDTGETRTVEVSVTPGAPTVGNGEADLPVRLSAAEGSEAAGTSVDVDLPVIWRYEDPRDVGAFFTVLTGLMLLSVLPLYLILVAVKAATAKYTTARLQGETIELVIGPDGPRREPAAPNGLLLDDSRLVPVPADPGGFTHNGVRLGVEKKLLNPFSMPEFYAEPAATGQRILTSEQPPTADGSRGRATPGLGFFAAVLIDEHTLAGDEDEIRATAVVLVTDTHLWSADLDRLLRDTVPWSTIAQWRSQAKQSATPAAAASYTAGSTPPDDAGPSPGASLTWRG